MPKPKRAALQALPVNHAAAAAGAAAGRSFAPPTEEDDIQDVLFETTSIDYATQEVLEEPTRHYKRKRALLLDAMPKPAPRRTRRSSAAAAAATAAHIIPAGPAPPSASLAARRARLSMVAPRVPDGVEDIDLSRARDPAYCYPYGSDSFTFLRQMQFRDGQVLFSPFEPAR